MELIDTERDRTYSELLELCTKTFDIKMSQCRLRHYDPLMHVRMQPVEAESQSKLFTITSMHNYMCYDLEIAKDDFEEYSPDWIFVKVCVWEPEI